MISRDLIVRLAELTPEQRIERAIASLGKSLIPLESRIFFLASCGFQAGEIAAVIEKISN